MSFVAAVATSEFALVATDTRTLAPDGPVDLGGKLSRTRTGWAASAGNGLYGSALRGHLKEALMPTPYEAAEAVAAGAGAVLEGPIGPVTRAWTFLVGYSDSWGPWARAYDRDGGERGANRGRGLSYSFLGWAPGVPTAHKRGSRERLDAVVASATPRLLDVLRAVAAIQAATVGHTEAVSPATRVGGVFRAADGRTVSFHVAASARDLAAASDLGGLMVRDRLLAPESRPLEAFVEDVPIGRRPEVAPADALVGDIDDVDDGTAYAKVAATEVSGGQIVRVRKTGANIDVDDLFDVNNNDAADITETALQAFIHPDYTDNSRAPVKVRAEAPNPLNNFDVAPYDVFRSGTQLRGQTVVPMITVGNLRSRQWDYTGSLMTSTSDGALPTAGATITVQSHKLRIGSTDIAYSSGSISGVDQETEYWVYADDSTFGGGSVAYAATTDPLDVFASLDRYFVGQIVTPDGLSTGGTGGGGGGGGGQDLPESTAT